MRKTYFLILLFVFGILLMAMGERDEINESPAIIESSQQINDQAIKSSNQLVVQIKGMSCEGCVYKLEKTFSKVEGVTDCTVNLKEQRILLNLEEGISLSPDEIRLLVQDKGYQFISIL